jgi:NAD(P)-dependent dehydrogenase (short-subunit alcohol dehydrogenase family)
MPGLDLKGRTVFITGAARGIGAAAAERLHARGANVVLAGLEPERLATNVERLGERAASFEVDVTDLDALREAVAFAVDRFGAIDVAIANAGISYTGTLADSPVEQVERTLEVNLLGVWRTDRAVIEELRRSRGYLLNIASLAAATHSPGMGPYATAKAGVEAMTNALRLESAPSGIAVGCAYFGFIDTDLVRAGFSQPSWEQVSSKLPKFIREPAPLSVAIDAIERGVEKRSARVWAPRYVGAMLALRGIMQPLTERRTLSDMPTLEAGLAMSGAEGAQDDPILGVAARVLDTEQQVTTNR